MSFVTTLKQREGVAHHANTLFNGSSHAELLKMLKLHKHNIFQCGSQRFLACTFVKQKNCSLVTKRKNEHKQCHLQLGRKMEHLNVTCAQTTFLWPEQVLNQCCNSFDSPDQQRCKQDVVWLCNCHHNEQTPQKISLVLLLTCMSVKENEWQFDKTSNIFWQLDSKNADWVSQKGCVFFSKRHMTSATKKLTQTFTMFNKIKTVQMQNFSRHLFFMQRILCSSHSMLFVLTTNASQLWRMRDTEIPHSFFHSDNLIVALWVNAKWGWIPCLFLIEFVQQWKCDQRGCTVEKSNALDSSCLLNTWLVFESITNIHCALPRDLHVNAQSRFAKRTKQLHWQLCRWFVPMLLVKDTFSDFNKLPWSNGHIICSSICLISFCKTIATKWTCSKLLHFLAFSLTVHVNAVVLLQCALSSQFFFAHQSASLCIVSKCSLVWMTLKIHAHVSDLSDKKTQMGKFANMDLCENCRSTLPITDGRNKLFTDGRNKIIHVDEAGAVRFGWVLSS